MHESNYQQLHHIFTDFCISQERILVFHHFLELRCHTFFDSYIYQGHITKGNFLIAFLEICLALRGSGTTFNIYGFLVTVPILIFIGL